MPAVRRMVVWRDRVYSRADSLPASAKAASGSICGVMLAARGEVDSPPVSNSAFAATRLEWDGMRIARQRAAAAPAGAARRRNLECRGIILRRGYETLIVGTGRPVVAIAPD